MRTLILSLLMPISVFASEAQLACDLERSKAEVQASTLSAPAVYGTLGQDPITTSKSAIAGVSQSFSGRAQAKKIREAAEARCESIRSTLQLDELARWSQLQVQRDGAIAELSIVESAILAAKENISNLDAQLSAHSITIMEHTSARQALVSLEDRQADLLRILSTSVILTQSTNVQSLLERSRVAEGLAARLAAEAQADAGWDVSIQTGIRQPLDGRKSTTYSNLTFRWSFGSNDSRKAAQAVGGYTEALAAAQQSGYTQTVVRQQDTLKRLIQAETLAASTSARQEEHLRRIRAPIVGIDTALALNALRTLNLQLKVLEADRVGAETRLAGYKALLEKIS